MEFFSAGLSFVLIFCFASLLTKPSSTFKQGFCYGFKTGLVSSAVGFAPATIMDFCLKKGGVGLLGKVVPNILLKVFQHGPDNQVDSFKRLLLLPLLSTYVVNHLLIFSKATI